MGKQIRKVMWTMALGAIFLLGACVGPPAAVAADDLFDGLQKRLVKDGYDKETIEELYSRPGVAFDVDSVALFFVHSESKLDYGQFSRPEAIKRARAYMVRHAQTLDKAEAEYGVDKEIITAIILVETQLGRYVGRSVVINTLSTMAALHDARIREYLYGQVPKDKRLPHRKFEKKARAKSTWAYRELKALIEFSQDQGIDATLIKGSYAGAMGLSQFMPSNALLLGVDGSGDGSIDLFDDADAIHSVAYYLKYHGWKKGISDKRAHRVIRHYNNSTYYADGVLAVAAELKK